MSRVIALCMVALVACKEPILEHCRWRGEHVFCAASFPDAPYCSPCARVEQMNGCVPTPPEHCAAFEPPQSSTGVATSEGTSSTTAPSGEGSSSDTAGSSSDG